VKKKNPIDSFLPFTVLSCILFLSSNYFTTNAGVGVGIHIALGLVYVPFLLLEFFKFKHWGYVLAIIGAYLIHGSLWTIFEHQAMGFIPFAITYTIINAALILYFNYHGNKKLYERGFIELQQMDINSIKELLPDKCDEFQNNFLSELTDITQLRSTQLDSYDQNFRIVEIRNIPSNNWTLLFIDSKYRKSMVVISRDERNLKFYSLPVEDDYKLDLLLHKALEKLK
jgi:hypothetical protein